MIDEQKTAPHEFWLYRRGGDWSRIPDFIAQNDMEFDDEMSAAGYSRSELHYGNEFMFMVEVYAKSHPSAPTPPYEFFVWLSIGSRCEGVAVPTLPDLLALIAEVMPLVKPMVAAIVPSSGWTAAGRPVAAFALDEDGEVRPLVEPEHTTHKGGPNTSNRLSHGFGPIRGPRR